jgi:hypothetical protein
VAHPDGKHSCAVGLLYISDSPLKPYRVPADPKQLGAGVKVVVNGPTHVGAGVVVIVDTDQVWWH